MTRNDFEPDLCFYGAQKATAISRDTWRFPAPDLAVEVLSDSTEVRDRGIKREDYAAHGVQEYWIIDADAETIEQYLLQGTEYALALKLHDGDLTSTVVPGLVLLVRALFDYQANLAALRAILCDS